MTEDGLWRDGKDDGENELWERKGSCGKGKRKMGRRVVGREGTKSENREHKQAATAKTCK